MTTSQMCAASLLKTPEQGIPLLPHLEERGILHGARLLPLHLLRGPILHLGRRRPSYARVAGDALGPRAPQELYAPTLVARAVARVVAVRLEAKGRVPAGEEELLPVTHVCGFLLVKGGTRLRKVPVEGTDAGLSVGRWDARSTVSSVWVLGTPKRDVLGRTGMPKAARLEP